MSSYFQSLENVFDHQSNFSKMCLFACQKSLKLPFLTGFKNGLCHLDPIFMPFSKWCITFLYLENWRSYKAICKFSSIFHGIKIGSRWHNPYLNPVRNGNFSDFWHANRQCLGQVSESLSIHITHFISANGPNSAAVMISTQKKKQLLKHHLPSVML